MNELKVFVWLICVQAVACSGATSTIAPQPGHTSICDLSALGSEMDGTVVRFKATYITDLRHGAYLTDSKCPLVSVELAGDDSIVDPSVRQFNEVVMGNILDHTERRFSVDISGMFSWSTAARSRRSSADAHGTIPPHGVVAIQKVWKYERVGSRK